MSAQPSNPRVERVLERLKGRIRTYVFLEGLALLVALVCLLFWLSIGLDVVYFWLRRLELPRWFRAGYVALSLVAVVACAFTYLVFRLVRSFRAKALALVLERRFPELDDRLVTAVEMSERSSGETSHDSPITRAMLERTIADATRTAGGLELSDVFAKRPLRLATIAAVSLLLVTVVFGATNSEAMTRWAQGFIALEDVYWNRDTDLRVKVLVQPGDVVRDFRTAEGAPTNGRPGVHKHPRGTDLTLLIVVPEGRNHRGEPWKIPDDDRVTVRFRQDNGTGGTNRAIPVQDDRLLERENARAIYKVARANLQSGMDVSVTGGDFTNRRPYRIEVVEPPRLDQIVLDCDFPDYTHWNEIEGRREQVVAGVKHTLPAETRFVLRASANKPVVAARLEFGDTELVFGETVAAADPEDPESAEPTRAFEAQKIVRSADGSRRTVEPLPRDVARLYLREDGGGLRVPFYVSAAAPDVVRERAAEPLANLGTPFHVAPDTELQITLTDADGIESVEPARLVLDAFEDHAPELQDLGLTAIGSRITKTARIPFEGLIVDDYGIVNARFDYRIVDRERAPEEEVPDDEAAEPDSAVDAGRWRPRPFRDFPNDEPREYHLRSASADRDRDELPTVEKLEAAMDSYQRFDVLPLDMQDGQRLILTVYAEDGDDLNGPHETRSVEFEFEIVSESDLLSFLYAREMDLFERLQQVIDEVARTRTELDEARGVAANYDAAENRNELTDAVRSLEVTAERSLHQTRTSAGELGGIRISFSEIVQELLNNGVDERHVERMVEYILDPLTRCTELHFPELDKAVGLFRLNVEERRATADELDRSIAAADALLAELERVRKELEDRVSYLKAVKELKDILDQEERVKAKTEERQKRELIDDLQKLDDLELDE